MEAIAVDIDRVHFRIGDLDAFRVVIFIETALDIQPGARAGRSDQLDDDLVADQRFSAPVLRDEGEEPMFDAVPFAGAGRVMSDGNRQPGLVSEDLKFPFPQPYPSTIAATAVGGNQKPGRVGIASLSQGEPPTPDALDGESRGIMIDTDIDPAELAAMS